MLTDFILASGHHLAAFLLFGALFAEAVMLRPGVDGAAIRRLGAVDAIYGLSAAAVVIFGVARVAIAAKGWDYYQGNTAFWLKMALFAAVGLLSIRPTLAFRRWRRLSSPPSDGEVHGVRRYLHMQIGLFALIPIMAAAMARGYGQP